MTGRLESRAATALLGIAVAACSAAEAPGPLASAPLGDEDCRGEVMGPVRFFLHPADPEGPILIVEDDGSSVAAVWDPRISVTRDDGTVTVHQGGTSIPGDRVMLIGSRLPGFRFLVCQVRPAGKSPTS